MSYLEYCSNCGNENERNHIEGNIRFHCVICKTIHYENPKPTATLICPKGNSILLGRRAFNPGKGEWGLPGNHTNKRWENSLTSSPPGHGKSHPKL